MKNLSSDEILNNVSNEEIRARFYQVDDAAILRQAKHLLHDAMENRLVERNMSVVNERYYRNSRMFTEAWKEAVRLAGSRYFGPGDIATATDYHELRPIRQSIEEVLGVLSPAQRQFLLALYSFYNDMVAGEMAEAFDEFSHSVNGLAYKLDEQRKTIIARLIVHYPGW